MKYLPTQPVDATDIFYVPVWYLVQSLFWFHLGWVQKKLVSMTLISSEISNHRLISLRAKVIYWHEIRFILSDIFLAWITCDTFAFVVFIQPFSVRLSVCRITSISGNESFIFFLMGLHYIHCYIYLSARKVHSTYEVRIPLIFLGLWIYFLQLMG